MPTNYTNNGKKRDINVITVIIIGVVSLILAVLMNVIGFKQVLNQDSTDRSGFASFIIPESKETKQTNTEKSQEDTAIKAKNITAESLVILTLNNNSWDRVSANLKDFTLDKDGNAVYKGYTLYCNSRYVKYVIFNEDCEDAIVGGLKVSDTYAKIKETLGEPTFINDDFIGYKTISNYYFFYPDKIVVYPNTLLDGNSSLENIIIKYANSEYLGNRTNFVMEVKELCQDIETRMDGEDVILESTIRQISIRLTTAGDIYVTAYNGYKPATYAMQNKIDEKIFEKDAADFVEMKEIERMNENK